MCRIIADKPPARKNHSTAILTRRPIVLPPLVEAVQSTVYFVPAVPPLMRTCTAFPAAIVTPFSVMSADVTDGEPIVSPDTAGTDGADIVSPASSSEWSVKSMTNTRLSAASLGLVGTYNCSLTRTSPCQRHGIRGLRRCHRARSPDRCRETQRPHRRRGRRGHGRGRKRSSSACRCCYHRPIAARTTGARIVAEQIVVLETSLTPV